MGTQDAGSDAHDDLAARHDALQRRIDRFQELAGMGDFSIDLATGRIAWSDEHYRIYGFEPQSFEPTAEVLLDMMHPDDRERIQEVADAALVAGEAYELEGRVVRADGVVRHLLSSGRVVTDDDGRPVEMIGTVIDVTDRVLAEQEHEAARVRLDLERQRRGQAVEINDTVLQGLSAAGYALELGQLEHCATYLQETLEAARRMVTDLMGHEDEVDAVPLTRTTPAQLGQPRPAG